MSGWVDCLYQQYRAFTGLDGVRLWGRPVLPMPGTEADGRDSCFWHLITNSRHDGRRRLDPGRAALVGRVWQLLELAGAEDARVLTWHEDRHVFIAPVDLDMVVVLKRRRAHYRLKTAYPTTGPKSRRRTERRALAGEPVDPARERPERHPLWQSQVQRDTCPQVRHALGEAW